jgi:hypothetical protein
MRKAIPALVALGALLGAGCAAAGRRAAEGAQQTLRESQAADTNGTGSSVAETAGQHAVRGAAEELGSPETATHVRAAVDAALHEALDEVHDEFASGHGRLARDLDRTARRASAAAVRGVHAELESALDEAFGACGELDRRACLHREVRALGEEASAGFMDGILRAHAWTLAAIVFAVGAACALIARGAWDLMLSRGRGAGRES